MYEIYKTKSGRRVNIGDYSYPLEVLAGNVNSFNAGDKYDGTRSKDPVLDAWLQAAREVGVPLRYSWRGIMSSLGDHGSVAPPWKPKERDYNRDDSAPLLERNWKVWVEWRFGKWAEYTIIAEDGSLACMNSDGLCFNGYEAREDERIASNVPEIAEYILARYAKKELEIIQVTSFDDLNGTLMPCPIYQDQDNTAKKEARLSIIGHLTSADKREALVQHLLETFSDFRVSPLKTDARGPLVFIDIWHDAGVSVDVEHINQLVREDILWTTNMYRAIEKPRPQEQ